MQCKSYSHFFSKKFQHICVSLNVNLNESLTNDIVSFEQLGLECFFIYALLFLSFLQQNHTWYAEAELLGNPQYGGLDGVLSTTFDTMTGRALFPNLNITGFGFFYIRFRVYSDPAGFNFTINERMKILNPKFVGMVPEEEYQIEVNEISCSTSVIRIYS